MRRLVLDAGPLVDSIIQIIQSLPKSEQNILREKLNQAVASEAEPIDEEA